MHLRHIKQKTGSKKLRQELGRFLFIKFGRRFSLTCSVVTVTIMISTGRRLLGSQLRCFIQSTYLYLSRHISELSLIHIIYPYIYPYTPTVGRSNNSDLLYERCSYCRPAYVGEPLYIILILECIALAHRFWGNAYAYSNGQAPIGNTRSGGTLNLRLLIHIIKKCFQVFFQCTIGQNRAFYAS
jgi:hypothetical protein